MRSKFFLAMCFGRKSVFLWFPAGAFVVGVLLCTAMLPIVFVAVVLRLVLLSYIVPLIQCPLQGLGRDFYCIIGFIVHVSSYFLQSTLHCSCLISVPSAVASLFMFHLISISPHFIDHVSFLFPSVHSPSHSFHLPQSISFIFTLFGCIHITCSFNHIVSFTFQPIPSVEINDLQVSLDRFLILDRYSLLEAGTSVVLLLIVSLY